MKVTINKTVSTIVHECNEFFDIYYIHFTDFSSFECGGFYELPPEIQAYVSSNKPTRTNIEVDSDNIDSPYTTYKYIYDVESEV